MSLLKCPHCGGSVYNTNEEIFDEKYNEKVYLWICDKCKKPIPESKFFGEPEFLIWKYADEDDLEEAGGDDYDVHMDPEEIWGRAMDEWENESISVFIDVENDIETQGYAIIKMLELDYYGLDIAQFLEHFSAMFNKELAYEKFSRYSYRVRLLNADDKPKSPINWYGGKYYMTQDISDIMPPQSTYTTYAEEFGGAAHMLFKKPPSPVEVYNDLNEGLYLFFKTLRDEEKRFMLLEQLQLTPYSRKEFEEAKATWRYETDPLEKVRKFYVATMQARNANGGWAYSINYSARGIAGTVSKWLGNIDGNIIPAIDRLREVQVENLNAIDCIKKYDSERTLHFIDPPYVPATRKQKKSYDHEMTVEQHEELIATLLQVEGKVILCGYDNDIYNELLNYGWKKVLLGEYVKHSIKEGREEEKGSEFVWINYDEAGNIIGRKHIKEKSKKVEQLNLLSVI